MFLSLIGIAFVLLLPKLVKNKGVKILLILLVSPMVGLYFYQGNYTVLYDYYITGYYLIFILLLAIVLGRLWKTTLGKAFVSLFFIIFLFNNFEVLTLKLGDRLDGPGSIGFLLQRKAIDWVYQDSQGESFNVDVYVPPVIPYAYDYLFKWYGGTNYGRDPLEEKVPLLYTLYEGQPPDSERLQAWLKRQEGIGKVEQEVSFGGITVQRRTRR